MFGLESPIEVEGVPSEILDPRNSVSGFLCIPFLYPLFYCLEFFCFSDVISDFNSGLQWSNKNAYEETLLKLA